MYSCHEASRIASEGLERRLSVGEWLNLKMHLSLCSNCRSFERNIRIIDEVIRTRASRPAPSELLSDEEMEILQLQLRAIVGKPG